MDTKRELAVFAFVDEAFVPAGLLTLTEDGTQLNASEFAYGIRYIDRPRAVEIDPVSLALKDKESFRGKKVFPKNSLPFFGGIRDAAPDAWGRRVIEAKLTGTYFWVWTLKVVALTWTTPLGGGRNSVWARRTHST